MDKMVCPCRYVYDPEVGDPKQATAHRLCPNLIVVEGHYNRYVLFALTHC